MRTIPFTVDENAFIKALVTITAATRSAVFTTNATDITIDTQTWAAAPGTNLSPLQTNNDATIANCTITAVAIDQGLFQPGDVSLGLYDGASVTIEICDANNPTAGKVTLLIGNIGQSTEDYQGNITLEARSVLAKARSIVSETFGPMCRAEYGDDRCKIAVLPADIARSTAYIVAIGGTGTRDYDTVNSAWGRVRIVSANDPSDYQNLIWQCTTAGTTAASAPAYSGPIGTVITDGSAQFAAVDSLCRYAKIASLCDSTGTVVTAANWDGHNVLIDRQPETGASADGYYTLGTLILRSGDNSGLSFQLSNWTEANNQASFFLDCGEVIVGGEWIEIMRGCDKTEETCFGRDNNIINRRAETFVPGRDLLLSQV